MFSIFKKKKDKETKEKNISAIIITDLHGLGDTMQEELKAAFSQNYDVCFILGDCYENDIAYLSKYLDTSKTFGVSGNHDAGDIYERYGIENIHGKKIIVKNKPFVGWGGSVKYKPSVIGMSQDESIDFEKDLPEADYLVAHDGPFDESDPNIAHQGLKGISNYQNRTKCFIIRGHRHTKYETNIERCFYGVERCQL